ncbi:hypothetical protein NG791_21155 [Laspinema sp. D1]|uniref:hypothetical protein n=1 Tax=Laspinema palackyanum TaxID=3231601 RepID=UPI0034949E8E|nr:hypothetical protein [Laspinema sp. D2b]
MMRIYRKLYHFWEGVSESGEGGGVPWAEVEEEGERVERSPDCGLPEMWKSSVVLRKQSGMSPGTQQPLPLALSGGCGGTRGSAIAP